MPDWQTILVALFIIGAALYAGRRALSRLRSFRTSKRNPSSCEAGCGCSSTGKQDVAIEQKPLTPINRARSS
ncbi:MAG TPA: FeoB-associated Cys-rich membrane protein [Pyrinomonadaceae bacterium]|nr:FeoB-associated Cys-rich membrane protein [Pyrinomonadaceae bacterium]